MSIVECDVCPHRCKLKEGEVGLCGARKNVGGKIVNLAYGKVSVVAIERIEKKPIFNYKPKSLVVTAGSVGCNLRCPYCQNYEISQTTAEQYKHFAELPPKQFVALAKKYDGVAFSYNEPLINYEYVRDTFKLAKGAGLITALSTNGYISRRVTEETIPFTDAANVDVKGFTDDFYQILGGSLKPVLETAELFSKSGVHTEITYLAIEGYNDSNKEITAFADWVQSLKVKAVHIPRFYPHYRWRDNPPTQLITLQRIAKILKGRGIDVHAGWEEHFGVRKA